MLALSNVRRRGWYFSLAGIILGLTAVVLVLTLGYLHGVRQRINVAEEDDIRRIGLLEPTRTLIRNVPPEQWSPAFDRLSTVLKEQPGVEGVGLVQYQGLSIDSGAKTRLKAGVLNADLGKAFPLPLAQGRWFTPEDWSETHPRIPVVVSSQEATRFPLGSEFTLYVGPPSKQEALKVKVIGVARDRTYYFDTTSMDLAAVLPLNPADIYVPMVTSLSNFRLPKAIFLIAPSEATLESQRDNWIHVANEALADLMVGDETQAYSQLWSMQELETSFRHHFKEPLVISSWLVGIVLVLATFGFGSLNAISVWERKQEFGIHFATGATRVGIAGMLVLETILPMVIPAVFAAVVAWGTARTLALSEFTFDIWVLTQTVGVLLVIASVSSLGPVLFISNTSAGALVKGLQGE